MKSKLEINWFLILHFFFFIVAFTVTFYLMDSRERHPQPDVVEIEVPIRVSDMAPGSTGYGRMLSGMVIKYQGNYIVNPDSTVLSKKDFPNELGIRRCDNGTYMIIDTNEYERWFTGSIQLLRSEYEFEDYDEYLEELPKLALSCPEDS